MSFNRNVFVNCPFDEDYGLLLQPLLFSIVYLRFTPRIALERLNSGEARINKIIKLITESKYAIHDLSRLRAERAGEYYRLNMPFELGVDVACRLFKRGRWSTKKCLVLEAEPYRYQAALSDLSNSDIAVHKNDPEEVVSQVRNWLNNEARLRAPGPNHMWGEFLEFKTDNFEMLRRRGFSDVDVEWLPVSELITCMQSRTMTALTGMDRLRMLPEAI